MIRDREPSAQLLQETIGIVLDTLCHEDLGIGNGDWREDLAADPPRSLQSDADIGERDILRQVGQRHEPDRDALVQVRAAQVGRPHRRPDSSRRQPIDLDREHRALLVGRKGGGRHVLEVGERPRTLASFGEELPKENLRPRVLRLET